MATPIELLEQANKDNSVLSGKVATLEEQVSKLTAERDGALATAEAVKKDADAQIAKANDAAKKASDELAQELAAHGTTKEDLKKARHALENPAFADAATRGSASPTPEGGAAPAAEPLTREQAVAEYRKIQDPVARARYRNEHGKELGIA